MDKALLAITGAFRTGGGIAAVNRLIFHTLAAAGWEIDYFSLMEADSNLTKEMTSSRRVAISVCHNQKAVFASRVALALLRRRYDLVFCDHVNLASILGTVSKLGFCRYAVWLHGVEVFPPRPDFEGRVGLSQAWRGLASSAFTRQEALRRYPRKVIAVCEPALDPIRNPLPIQSELSCQPEPFELVCITGERQQVGKRAILCVGRMSSFERYKGQDTLIQAFSIIKENYADAQLILVGEGDDAPRLYGLAKDLPKNQHRAIFMPGKVEQGLLRRLYHRCSLFAMPSTGEGFGIVYLEAMSFARPCLGGGLDAASGLIKDGINGRILKNPHNPVEVARSVIELFADQTGLEQMGKVSYDLVQANYCFSHFQERFWKGLAEPTT